MANLKLSILLLLVIAFAVANLPFLVERRLFVFAQPAEQRKNFWWRLAEHGLLFFVIGGVALWLEQRAGQIYPQRWEFYAIAYCLFVVFAYPGFVYRYLWKRGRA